MFGHIRVQGRLRPVPLHARWQAGVWSSAQCEASLNINGIYEAAGLALWLQTGVFSAGKADEFKADVNWNSLTLFKGAWFDKHRAFKTTAQRMQGSKKVKMEKGTLLWPTEMICAVSTVKDAAHDSFESSLPLLSNGKYILWAWYLALFDAICEKATCRKMQASRGFLSKFYEA